MGSLEFHLGKIPVRVHATFFLMAAFLGLYDTGLIAIVSWVAIVLVSVLFHELGHATMGLTFGLSPRIDLHGMGGTTSWAATTKPLSHAKRIAISLAGPFAGFALWAVVLGLAKAGVFPDTPRWQVLLHQTKFVNVWWGVLNLLPLLPLDGGNVMTQALHALTGGHGERPARITSIVVAVVLLPLALLWGSWWGALLVFSFLASNWRGLKDLSAREHDAPLRASLEKAQAALDVKDAARVLEFARPAALAARTEQVRAEALHLVACGFLLEGRVADADAAIAALPRGYAPHPQLVALREVAARQ
jgi:Zn-dependent protease